MSEREHVGESLYVWSVELEFRHDWLPGKQSLGGALRDRRAVSDIA
jgi:hypothetical protein